MDLRLSPQRSLLYFRLFRFVFLAPSTPSDVDNREHAKITNVSTAPSSTNSRGQHHARVHNQYMVYCCIGHLPIPYATTSLLLLLCMHVGCVARLVRWTEMSGPHIWRKYRDRRSSILHTKPSLHLLPQRQFYLPTNYVGV